ncbi:hypothetical protein [Argonema antarcticum]|uniref:hypothetical protein n=1 Tax=Argonema antarcticum TaxID=2942763 RepID=UPI002012D267|nr:hypothetical protein [Argonema antarcticum]MCL1469376.1 hypothetical protein [Argonema antarcticum A004/B2]
MLDPKEIGDFLRKYFTEISDEQFLEDYKRFCPEITDPDAYQGIEPLTESEVRQEGNKEISDLPQESEKVREQAINETKNALKKLIATYQNELPNNLVFTIEDNTVQAVVTFLRSEELETLQKEDLSLVYRQKQAS